MKIIISTYYNPHFIILLFLFESAGQVYKQKPLKLSKYHNGLKDVKKWKLLNKKHFPIWAEGRVRSLNRVL